MKVIIKLKFYFMNKALVGVLLGAAAYGIYRFAKMTPEQKTNLKKRGKEFLDKNMNGLNNVMDKRRNSTVNTETTPPY
jgi:hypothetical protein